jgi:hypothetical protein
MLNITNTGLLHATMLVPCFGGRMTSAEVPREIVLARTNLVDLTTLILVAPDIYEQQLFVIKQGFYALVYVKEGTEVTLDQIKEYVNTHFRCMYGAS